MHFAVNKRILCLGFGIAIVCFSCSISLARQQSDAPPENPQRPQKPEPKFDVMPSADISFDLNGNPRIQLSPKDLGMPECIELTIPTNEKFQAVIGIDDAQLRTLTRLADVWQRDVDQFSQRMVQARSKEDLASLPGEFESSLETTIESVRKELSDKQTKVLDTLINHRRFLLFGWTVTIEILRQNQEQELTAEQQTQLRRCFETRRDENGKETGTLIEKFASDVSAVFGERFGKKISERATVDGKLIAFPLELFILQLKLAAEINDELADGISDLLGSSNYRILADGSLKLEQTANNIHAHLESLVSAEESGIYLDQYQSFLESRSDPNSPLSAIEKKMGESVTKLRIATSENKHSTERFNAELQKLVKQYNENVRLRNICCPTKRTKLPRRF